MCLYSQVILNPKYKPNKKNGGNIPAVQDERTKYVPIGCQDCIECRKKKAREWQVRLLEDIKTNTMGKFITLTFSNESYTKLAEEIINRDAKEGIETPTGYELDNQVATLAMRRFNERWRQKYKKALRHWMVTEIGHNGTENIHLHGIIWTNQTQEVIAEKWHYGYIWMGKYVNERTVNYIIKYVTKKDLKHRYYKQLILTSPGIGGTYTKRNEHKDLIKIDAKKNIYKGTETTETYRTSTGHKIAMPIYWRNKIYSEDEREKLWIQKLDKQERWICGEKISIKKNEEDYYKVLAHHRKRNKELGYGTGEKDWNREQYERQRRIIMQRARMIKA